MNQMPNPLCLCFDLGQAYRRYADELLACHKDFLGALRNLQRHALLTQVFVFSDEMVTRALCQSMHYLHAYF